MSFYKQDGLFMKTFVLKIIIYKFLENDLKKSQLNILI